MSEARPVHTWLTDMDGVLVHEEDPIPGAAEFIEALKNSGLTYLLITNNSIYTRRDLRARLLGSGIDVPEDRIFTSALATADFLRHQRPGGTAYVVGESGLTTASCRGTTKPVTRTRSEKQALVALATVTSAPPDGPLFSADHDGLTRPAVIANTPQNRPQLAPRGLRNLSPNPDSPLTSQFSHWHTACRR